MRSATISAEPASFLGKALNSPRILVVWIVIVSLIALVGVIAVLAIGGRPDPSTLRAAAPLLDGAWRFHIGDDPHWANADADDSGWETMDLSAPATSIDFGNFGGRGRDAAFLSGGQIYILRSSLMQVAAVSLPVSARAFALGAFIYDRSGGTQIALRVAPDDKLRGRHGNRLPGSLPRGLHYEAHFHVWTSTLAGSLPKSAEMRPGPPYPDHATLAYFLKTWQRFISKSGR